MNKIKSPLLTLLIVFVAFFAIMILFLILDSRLDFTVRDYSYKNLTVAKSTLEATALIHVAQAEGYFDSAGLAVEVIEDSLGSFSLNQVLEGTADIATVAELPVVEAVLQGNDVRIISTMHTSNKNIRLLVRRDAGIESLADLPGKRLATTKGTVGEYFLYLLLDRSGVDRYSIEIVDMSPSEIQSAIDDKLIDGFALREPHVFKAQERLQASAITFPVSPVDQVYTATFNLVTTQSVIENKAEEIKLFLTALKRAEQYAQENPEIVKWMLVQEFDLTKEYVDAIWDASDFKLSLDASIVALMTDQATWKTSMGEYQFETPIPDMQDFIESGFLRNIDPSAVTLQQ